MGRRLRGNPPALDARALQQLQAASPTANQIIDNMDAFNEEIEEQAAAKGVELIRSESVESAVDGDNVEDELDRINRELEEKLRRQRELEAQRAEAERAEADKQPPQKDETPDIETQVIALLKEHKNAPSDAQIEKWKQQYGESGVQVLSMGKGDAYVFTYLRRNSFQKIQTAMSKQAQIEGMAKDPEEFMMEQVLKQCILWPRPLGLEFFYNSRSGVIPTLYSAIMLHSYHLTPQQAMVITAQL